MEQTFTENDFKDPSPYVSPRPRLRSCSVRKTDFLSTEEWDEMRPRTRSFPSRSEYKKTQLLSPTVSNEGDLYRVRSFETTSKGIVNLGDCMKSRSLNSIVSSCSSNTDISQESTDPGPVSPDCPVFRVSVLGSVGVGKTALLQQFMTSEYLGGFDTSLDSEAERSISISLDGEENSLSFTEIDLPDYSSLPIDAAQSYIVVYSIAKRITFDQATSTVRHLRKKAARSAPILVVGNKTDIVRRRTVTTEDGKSLAKKYSCKFIETSTILNYHVDELLVGILSQLRLKCSKSDETAKKSSCYKTATARLMDKLKAFHSDALKRKSCENLFAL